MHNASKRELRIRLAELQSRQAFRNAQQSWRRLLSEGGAVDSDEAVIGNSEVKKLAECPVESGAVQKIGYQHSL
jgi:hypothetical protein